MTEVRRDLWRPAGPSPCSSWATQSRVPRTMPPDALRVSLRRETHNLPRKPVLSHPHCKETLPDVQMEPPVLQFVPTGFCPVAEDHCCLAVISASSLRVFKYVGKTPPEPSLLSFFPHGRGAPNSSSSSQPFIRLSAVAPSIFHTGEH